MSLLENFLEKKYTCLCCTECCGAWNLPVEKSNMEFLKAQDFIKNILNTESADFMFKNDKYYLPQKDFRCLFINKNNGLCLIHESVGIQHKPLECIKYPFSILEDSKNNIYIETSFYCPGVIANEGENLSSYKLSDFIKECKKQSIPENISLSSEVAIEFDQAETIKLEIAESLVSNLASLPIADWWDVLLRHSRIFNQLENRISLNKEYDLQELLGKIQTLTTKDKDLFRQNILNAYIMIKQKTFPDSLSIYSRHGKIFDIIMNSKVELSNMQNISIEENEEIRTLFLRYLMDIFLRKTLLCDNYSILGIYLLSVSAYSLVLWYSKINALLRNDSKVSYEDIKKAIRLTERFYTAHNTSFLPLYKDALSFIVIRNLCII